MGSIVPLIVAALGAIGVILKFISKRQDRADERARENRTPKEMRERDRKLLHEAVAGGNANSIMHLESTGHALDVRLRARLERAKAAQGVRGGSGK